MLNGLDTAVWLLCIVPFATVSKHDLPTWHRYVGDGELVLYAIE